MATPHDSGNRDTSPSDGALPDLVAAIIAGDVERVEQLLAADPTMALATLNGRSMLHHANDWPGNRPNVALTIAALVRSGADPTVAFVHPTSPDVAEQPLHWAASNDDTEAVGALLDAGADVNALGGIFGGCTPFEEAIIFEQFDAARLLLDRGATNYLPGAAALGRDDLIEGFFDEHAKVRLDVGILANWPEDIRRQTILDRAFQFACRSGHHTIARLLLERGADPAAITPADTSARDEAAKNDHHEMVAWLDSITIGADADAGLSSEN